jgi:hypothetical protein
MSREDEDMRDAPCGSGSGSEGGGSGGDREVRASFRAVVEKRCSV